MNMIPILTRVYRLQGEITRHSWNNPVVTKSGQVQTQGYSLSETNEADEAESSSARALKEGPWDDLTRTWQAMRRALEVISVVSAPSPFSSGLL